MIMETKMLTNVMIKTKKKLQCFTWVLNPTLDNAIKTKTHKTFVQQNNLKLT